MMSLELYAAFVAAVTVLLLIPGPNVALIVANSVAHGRRYGLLTVAGTSTALVVQLAVTALGMTALLSSLAGWFEPIRWLGVAYLVYLGVKQWRAAPVELGGAAADARFAARIYGRGFLVSLTNPKTLLFYGAFLPQFVSPDANVARQLAILSVTATVLAIVVDSFWAVLAARLRSLLAVRGTLRNRITGGFLVGAGLGLAVARKS
jgi:homoserine/homoserine lactone efflux protein